MLLQDLLPLLPDSVPSVHEQASVLRNLTFDEFMARAVSGAVKLATNLAIALVVFYVGKFIIKRLYSLVRGIMVRRRVDSSLTSFVLSFIRIVLYFILIVTVIGILGIETSSFLALFASAGVAVGMALSGTLQNFAGGVLILLLKPYKVNDYIEAQGYAGTVKEIQIFHTLIVTPDNKAIIIPNGGLSTGSVNNWSKEGLRRVDWAIGISYGDSVETARQAICAIINAHPLVQEASKIQAAKTADVPANKPAEPTHPVPDGARHGLLDYFRSRHTRLLRQRREARRREAQAVAQALSPSPYAVPSVVVNSLNDSAVELKARAWVRTPDYWTVYYEVLEQVYTTLSQQGSGVNFPFPQLDVHLQNPSQS